MPINTDAILDVCQQLCEQENLRVTIKESAKAACIVGGSAFAGGILLGPPGMVIGSVASSIYIAKNSWNSYRPAAHVIMYDMTTAQKEKLAENVRKVIQDLRIEDCAILLTLVPGNVSVQAALTKEILKFLKNDMKLQIVS